ncbi:hypothetical protein [Glaesserella parasuis]|uniref:hypothetical protein n=1 Tax=Glaesserella parasuis TaxID=738 RepID=UPI003851F9D4
MLHKDLTLFLSVYKVVKFAAIIYISAQIKAKSQREMLTYKSVTQIPPIMTDFLKKNCDISRIFTKN